jgi:hypothetical protein
VGLALVVAFIQLSAAATDHSRALDTAKRIIAAEAFNARACAPSFAAHTGIASPQYAEVCHCGDIPIRGGIEADNAGTFANGASQNSVNTARRLGEVVVFNIAGAFRDEDRIAVEGSISGFLRPNDGSVLCPVRAARLHLFAAVVRSCHFLSSRFTRGTALGTDRW